MKERIEELIQHHKTAKEECNFLCNELYDIDDSKMSEEDKTSLESLKMRYAEESAWRGVFISQLENLI